MPRKTEQLQIRVTPDEKAALKRLSREASLDLSSYVLARALPQTRRRFAGLLRGLESPKHRSYAWAAINDFLARLSRLDFAEATGAVDISALGAFDRAYLAAMVELAAERLGCAPPPWTGRVAPVDEPWFATDLPGLRLHLLKESPVPFRRRNIFIDSSVGARV